MFSLFIREKVCRRRKAQLIKTPLIRLAFSALHRRSTTCVLIRCDHWSIWCQHLQPPIIWRRSNEQHNYFRSHARDLGRRRIRDWRRASEGVHGQTLEITVLLIRSRYDMGTFLPSIREFETLYSLNLKYSFDCRDGLSPPDSFMR